MADNSNIVEVHGCIVCGKLHNMLVVYTSSGNMIGCSAISPDCQPIPDPRHALVTCTTHTGAEIESALARRQTLQTPEDTED